MTISVLRTADAWWVATPRRCRQGHHFRGTTAELLADRAAIQAAASGADTVPVTDLELLSPVTTPCRVVAQMTNFASHVEDAGMDPQDHPADVLPQVLGLDQRSVRRRGQARPRQVPRLRGGDRSRRRRDIPVGTTISSRTCRVHRRPGGVTNDISARDIQLPQTQFYEAKSYPSFTPTGPALVLLDADELKRFGQLRLQLGQRRAASERTGRRRHAVLPVQALQSLSRFQDLAAGDLILTGTPVGTALSAPPKPIAFIASLLPPAVKWKAFFKSQARNPEVPASGDVIEASVGTDDGAIDLGTQRMTVVYA